MRVGIATDHGGFSLKSDVVAQLEAAGHQVVDFGAHNLDQADRAGLGFRVGNVTSARKAGVIGMHTFGASAPLKELQKKFGFVPDQVEP
jgi:ribose 5-phosphate isomerase RpiB